MSQYSGIKELFEKKRATALSTNSYRLTVDLFFGERAFARLRTNN